jgi:hypothetical protein
MSKVKLVKTCGACPEQYDAYIDGDNVGYLRLRHGSFTVEYRGMQVYQANPQGDGIFDHDEERRFFLNRACEAILAEWNAGKDIEETPLYEIVDDEEEDAL